MKKADALLRMAQAFARTGDGAQAEKVLRTVEQLCPAHPDIPALRASLAQVGLGRIVALCCRSSTAYQIH